VSTHPTSGRILTETQGQIGWVLLSNPSRHNALTTEMMNELHSVLRRFDEDPATRVVVVRGDGDTSFAAGADISEFASRQDSLDARKESDQAVGLLFGTLREMRTPTVMMIRGHCLGAGLAIATSGDIRIAAEGSRFAVPAAKLGVGYPRALTRALVGLIGPAHTADILYTGRTLTHEEAERVGLVNRVVPAASLQAVVDELVESISANAPLSIQAAKLSIAADASPALAGEADRIVASCIDSQDAVEGRRSFLEKRQPSFEGR
jgi:enoyl-CoA hydratase/carnithine racemase